MKRVFVSFIVFGVSIGLFAQNDSSGKQNSAPKFNLALSGGSNNFTSYIGILTEISPVRNFSALGGAGASLWGLKTSVGIRYYHHYPIGIFYGLSYSTVWGRKIDSLYIETFVNGDIVNQPLSISLKKTHTINLSMGYCWRISRLARAFLELGYSIPLNVNPYEIETKDIVLTETGKQTLDMYAPGGFIFGLGFSIGF